MDDSLHTIFALIFGTIGLIFGMGSGNGSLIGISLIPIALSLLSLFLEKKGSGSARVKPTNRSGPQNGSDNSENVVQKKQENFKPEMLIKTAEEKFEYTIALYDTGESNSEKKLTEPISNESTGSCEDSLLNEIIIRKHVMEQFPKQAEKLVLDDYADEYWYEYKKKLLLDYRNARFVFFDEITNETYIDVDEDVTIEEAISILRSHVNKEKIDTLFTCSRKTASEAVNRLELLESMIKRIENKGETLIKEYFPDTESIKTLHLSDHSTLFLLFDKDSDITVVRIEAACSERVSCLKPLLDYLKSPDYAGNLIPVIDFFYIPGENNDSGLLITRMPYMKKYKEFDHNGDTNWYYRKNAISFAKDTASALAELAAMGYVHTNISPENLFFMDKDKNRNIKIIVGGIHSAIPVKSLYQDAYTAIPSFFTPELQSRNPLDYSTDIFSWGFTMLSIFPYFFNRSGVKTITLKKYICGEIQTYFPQVIVLDVYKNKEEDLSRFIWTNWKNKILIREHFSYSDPGNKMSKKIYPNWISGYEDTNSEAFFNLWKIVLKAINPDPADRFKNGIELLDNLNKAAN